MKHILRILFAAAAILLIQTAPVAHAQQPYKEAAVIGGGTIRGVVRLAGGSPNLPAMEIAKDNDFCGRAKPSPRLIVGRKGGVQYAVVMLEGIARGKKIPLRNTAVLDQRRCMYEPHVLILPPGEQLAIVNNDPVLHNVHTYSMDEKRRTIFNIAQPIKGQRTPIKPGLFKSRGVVMAICDAGHPWMSAYVVLAEHPYYAVTDANGKFVLEDVPPGSYRLKMWHEGVATTRVEMENGKPKSYEYEAPYEMMQDVIVTERGTVEANFDLTLRSSVVSPPQTAVGGK